MDCLRDTVGSVDSKTGAVQRLKRIVVPYATDVVLWGKVFLAGRSLETAGAAAHRPKRDFGTAKTDALSQQEFMGSRGMERCIAMIPVKDPYARHPNPMVDCAIYPYMYIANESDAHSRDGSEPILQNIVQSDDFFLQCHIFVNEILIGEIWVDGVQ